MTFASGLLSDVGRVRTRNEDLAARDDGRGLYVLADGMGGHPAGHLASKIAVDTAMLYLTEKRVPGRPRGRADRLAMAIHAANAAILAVSREYPEAHGMGTTLAALWLAPKRVAVAHVGDSRVYRIRGQRIRQLTRDHTVYRELVDRGELAPDSEEAARVAHVLTQAVGLEPVIAPDMLAQASQPGDIYLLCSDGLTDMVTEAEIASHVAANAHDLERAAKVLVDAALEAGGLDNVTVLLGRAG